MSDFRQARTRTADIKTEAYGRKVVDKCRTGPRGAGSIAPVPRYGYCRRAARCVHCAVPVPGPVLRPCIRTMVGSGEVASHTAGTLLPKQRRIAMKRNHYRLLLFGLDGSA